METSRPRQIYGQLEDAVEGNFEFESGGKDLVGGVSVEQIQGIPKLRRYMFTRAVLILVHREGWFPGTGPIPNQSMLWQLASLIFSCYSETFAVECYLEMSETRNVLVKVWCLLYKHRLVPQGAWWEMWRKLWGSTDHNKIHTLEAGPKYQECKE
ncbi:hypothetical protein BSKO_13202 [Bryopsis sp. KO-2023]|nr:hypothetical protein BSKO_13202 [Bryopsis sp. KO-2023]